MVDMKRPIEEKLLGEAIIGVSFHDGADPEFQKRWLRTAVYVCPSDRRCIVKDVRVVWNPDEFDSRVADDPGATGSGAEVGDSRVVELRVNGTTVAREGATDEDHPNAIMFPTFTGGSASSFVLNPGDVLEVAMLADKTDTTGDSFDRVIARAQGVEVGL